MKAKIKLGDQFFVFTNWGICQGRVVDITPENQYRLNIDIDVNNKDKEHDFYYCEHQLFNSFTDAIDEALNYTMLEPRKFMKQ